MANESEKAIYNRLNGAPLFHPASAELFADDWTLESGDVVSVISGQDTYDVPVYGMNLKWNGGSTVGIQATGNQKREPLPALQRKMYGSGSSAYKQNKRYESKFLQQDNKIGMVVYERDGVNVINAAEIVAGINDEDGSTVHINANHIYLNGQSIQATGEFTSVALFADEMDCNSFWLGSSSGNFGVNCESYFYDMLHAEGGIIFGEDGEGYITGPVAMFNVLQVDDNGTSRAASWQSMNVVTDLNVSYTPYRFWVYATQSTDWQNHLEITSNPRERFVESVTKVTTPIFYLGDVQT